MVQDFKVYIYRLIFNSYLIYSDIEVMRGKLFIDNVKGTLHDRKVS